MCGIAGFIKRDSVVEHNEKLELDRMLERIHHRGPDDTGVCGFNSKEMHMGKSAEDIEGNSFIGLLGFNRLSIQDVSDAGHQPMCSENRRVVITFNGEIYNVEELKSKLQNDGCDMKFRGHSDTEVILKCYLMYGMDSTVKMLNGMFAIVIADIDRRLIYIARDRIGIIPCHIMVNDKRIIWGSEIKAFLELKDFDRKINLSALSDAVKYCYPNSSMYKAVKNVEPGTYYTYSWDNNKISRTVYFSLEEYKCGSIASLDECEEILRDCLKRQLVSDVPLGVQLSGGVDSTLLAKYTSDIYQSREQKLYGFSLVNRGHPKYSEEGWIDHAAKSLTVDLQKFDFNERVFAQNYEKSLYAFERFVNIPSPVGIYTFSSQARKNVTVLISGEGADELAGGYGTYSLSKMYGVMEKCLGKRICSRVRHWAPTTDCDRFIYYFDSMLSDEACKRIFPAFDVGENIEAKREFINSISGSYFEKLRKLYFKEELVSLLERQNKICMANSVENRVPFLDNRFIELVFSLNEDQLVHPNFSKALKHKNKVLAYEGKYLLKQMSERIYGKEFAFRNKQAVRVPLAQYMMYPIFHEYLDSTIISGMKNRGLVDMNEFKAAYENMDKGENEMIVWKAINMEVWMQLFADGRKVYEIL